MKTKTVTKKKDSTTMKLTASSATEKQTAELKKSKSSSFEELMTSLTESIENGRQEDVKRAISSVITHEFGGKEWDHIFSKYHVLIQYDDTTMKRIDADNIYRALKKSGSAKEKEILLILYSFGGDIASAYLISKLCREYTKKRFIIAIPRMAKSAATLICCGGDEIHMGSLSELGPLDPQINRLPALGLKNTIRQIAETVSEFPKASHLFAEYLAKTIPAIDFGYYDRIVDTASQYARRLMLKRCNKPKDCDIQKITTRLVYDYSDHGFVIDKSEAMEIFGRDVVKIDTEEYSFANAIYSLLRLMDRVCEPKYKFYFIGKYDAINSVGLIPAKKT